MAYDRDRHHRRSIRLPGYDYTQASAYFVTLVTAGRECLFGEVVDTVVQISPLGAVAAVCWQAIPHHFATVTIDAWVIMPNHVHGIIVIGAHSVGAHSVGAHSVGAQHAAPLRRHTPASPCVPPGSLGAIVRSFKSAVTKRAREMAGAADMPVWQRNYYEHIIRDVRELERIRRYIDENPQRWDIDDENPTYRRTGAGR